MKNRYSNKYIGVFIQLFLMLILVLSGCQDKKTKEEMKKDIKLQPHVVDTIMSEDDEGTYYSDSIIHLLTKQNENIQIDSFYDLHSFDRSKFRFEECDEFTMETLEVLDIHGIHTGIKKNIAYPEVTKSQNKLLGITEYLCDKTFSDKFKMYIFHSNNLESHYSNGVVLVTISNSTNAYDRLTLSENYLSEGYEYEKSSRFLSMNEVEITKKEKFNMSNNLSEDDSISITKIVYEVSDEGKITEFN